MQRHGGGVIEMVQQQLRSTRARVGMVWAGLAMGTGTVQTCRTVPCNSQKEKLKLIVCLLQDPCSFQEKDLSEQNS